MRSKKNKPDREWGKGKEKPTRIKMPIDEAIDVTLDISNDDHWKAIQSPKRLRVLEAIRELKLCTVNELTKYLHESRETMYYHIRLLLNAELIQEQEVKKSTATNKALLYSTRVPHGVICFTANPNSVMDMHRMKKIRKSGSSLLVKSFDENRKAGATGKSGERFFAWMTWVSVSAKTKIKIESLYDEIRGLIEQEHIAAHEKDSNDANRSHMLYAMWLIPDFVSTGPMPILVPKKK
jgi:DNA-binding transcriptional ArsR family regulator